MSNPAHNTDKKNSIYSLRCQAMFVPPQLCPSIIPLLSHSRLKTYLFHESFPPNTYYHTHQNDFTAFRLLLRFFLFGSLIKFLFWCHAANYSSPYKHSLNTCISNCTVHITLTERKAAPTSQRLNRTQGWKLTSSSSRGLTKDSVKSGIPLSLIRQSIYHTLSTNKHQHSSVSHNN